MTYNEARDKVIEMAQGNPGELSTSMCEALNISFDHFLQFAQLDKKGQKRVIQGLALALMTDKFGHCSQ